MDMIESLQAGSLRYEKFALVDFVVRAYVDRDDELVLNDEFNRDSVFHVHGDGVHLLTVAFEFMKAQGWVVGICFKQLDGFLILLGHFRMLF